MSDGLSPDLSIYRGEPLLIAITDPSISVEARRHYGTLSRNHFVREAHNHIISLRVRLEAIVTGRARAIPVSQEPYARFHKLCEFTNQQNARNILLLYSQSPPHRLTYDRGHGNTVHERRDNSADVQLKSCRPEMGPLWTRSSLADLSKVAKLPRDSRGAHRKRCEKIS